MHPIEGVDTETWQTQQLWSSSPTINSSFLKSSVQWFHEFEICLPMQWKNWLWTDQSQHSDNNLTSQFLTQLDTTWHDDKSQPVRTWHNLTQPDMMVGRLHSHCSHKSPETARLSTHQTNVQIVMCCMCSICNSDMSVFLLHSKTMQPLRLAVYCQNWAAVSKPLCMSESCPAPAYITLFAVIQWPATSMMIGDGADTLQNTSCTGEGGGSSRSILYSWTVACHIQQPDVSLICDHPSTSNEALWREDWLKIWKCTVLTVWM